jgi:RND family efflux transporter MFP subunit
MADESRVPVDETPSISGGADDEGAPNTVLPVVAGVVLLIGAVLLAWSQLGTGGGGAPPANAGGPGHGPTSKSDKKPVAVTVAVVEEDALTEEQRIPAEILPSRRAMLKAKSGGTLLRLRKRLGDVVAAGELIGTIEAGTLPAEVKRAEALTLVATARKARQAVVVEQLERDLARKVKLEGEGATSRTERERTENDLALARADLSIAAAEEARAQADVDILRMKLDDTRVVSPFSGRVARVHVDEGSDVTPGAALLDIVADTTPHVAFSVRESERARLRVGAPVDMRVPNAAGDFDIVRGEVERIGAELDPASRTLQVEAKLLVDENTPPLMPGTFVDVALALGATEAGLVVPREALIGRGPVRTLYLVEDGKVRAVDVNVLVEDARRAAVSGTTAGAEIVVQGRDLVSDGAKVEVTSRAAPAVKKAAAERTGATP